MLTWLESKLVRLFSSRGLLYLPFLILAAFPFFGTYNPSLSTFWYYDFLGMNRYILWFLFLMGCVVLVGVLSKDDVPLPTLFAVVLFFSIAEVWVNYPMIWRDIFLHGSVVQGITEQSYIGNTWNQYPQTQPGFFLLWSIVKTVTGLGIFESNLFLLLPVGVILVIMLLVLTFRALHIRTPNAAALLAFLLMNFNLNEYNFIHFNTRLLSLIYVLMFLFFFLRVESGRRRNVGLIIINVALVISHILNALVPLVFLGFQWLVDRKRSHESVSLFIFCAAAYIFWNIYQAYSLLAQGLPTLLNYYYVILAFDYLNAANRWLPAASQAAFGSTLADYYKALVGVLCLLSLYVAIKSRKQRAVRTLAFYMLSVLVVYGVSFFSILNWISVYRGLIFGAVALAGLPTILFTVTARNGLGKWKRKLFIIVLVLMIIPHFVLVHEQPYARMLTTGPVVETSTFLLNYRNGQTLITADDFPFYYSLYEPYYQGYQWYQFSVFSSSTSLANVTNFMSDGKGLKVLDYGQTLDWSLMSGHATSFNDGMNAWYTGVYSPLDQHYNRVYDTGYETIYD